MIDTGGAPELNYEPGDHIAIFPSNREELVSSVLQRMKQLDNPDKPVQLLVLKEVHTPNGKRKYFFDSIKKNQFYLRTCE